MASAECGHEILIRYGESQESANGGYLGPMIDLVQQLASSPLAECLFPGTSHHSLCLGMEPEFAARMDALFVGVTLSAEGLFHITMHHDDEEYFPTAWCSRCSFHEVFIRYLRRTFDRCARTIVPLSDSLVFLQSDRPHDRSLTRWLNWSTGPDGKKYWGETEKFWLDHPALWGPAMTERKRWLARSTLACSVLRAIDCPCARKTLRFFDGVIKGTPDDLSFSHLAPCPTGGCLAHELLRILSQFFRGLLLPGEFLSKVEDCVSIRYWQEQFRVQPTMVVRRARSAFADLAEAVVLDLLGNPFRSFHVDPAWLSVNNGAIRERATTIYERFRFDQMPELGKMLAGAGCADSRVLEHCSQATPHFRGCWVLDALLQPAWKPPLSLAGQ